MNYEFVPEPNFIDIDFNRDEHLEHFIQLAYVISPKMASYIADCKGRWLLEKAGIRMYIDIYGTFEISNAALLVGSIIKTNTGKLNENLRSVVIARIDESLTRLSEDRFKGSVHTPRRLEFMNGRRADPPLHQTTDSELVMKTGMMIMATHIRRSPEIDGDYYDKLSEIWLRSDDGYYHRLELKPSKTIELVSYDQFGFVQKSELFQRL